MCGICGIYSFSQDAPPVDQAHLERMRDEFAHRGPDDAGVYLTPDGRVGLANRRLSIIDLSAAGHQPMSNEDGSIWIAYNGEVYNYQAYRAELEAAGHRFASNTDTEVILHLYEEYGHDVVHKLRGMFAFVIWDSRRDELFFARDRIGVKPLYYTFHRGQFLFSSEIKAILNHCGVPREVDEQAFYHFLTFLVTPAPSTLFKGISKVPPGYRGVVRADGSLHMEEYWDVYSQVHRHEGQDEAFYRAGIVERLRESIGLRMISDVPFGVFLSGGIDSSTNVALMAELMDRPVQTFSVGYRRHPEFNELEEARFAARHYGADYHEVLIDVDDLIAFLPSLIYYQDEPIGDPVCVPLYFVSKLAKESGTTVIQVGEGADELFGGYTHWPQLIRFYEGPWRWYRQTPEFLRGLGLSAAGPLFNDTIRQEYLRRAARGEELVWSGGEAFGEAQKQRLVSPALRRRLGAISSHEVVQYHRRRFEERSPDHSYLSWMGYIDLKMRLPELLLMRVDKMTMATSVECRVPYLDHEFVSFVMGIPQMIRLKNLQRKHIFKEAVRGIVPDSIIERPKRGFALPIHDWFFELLGSFAQGRLRDFAARTDYFDPAYIERLLTRGDQLTWVVLNFVLWHEYWIEGREVDIEPMLAQYRQAY
ncbi:MAG: amidotransferase 1, exosortase A system-associated [Anaerolineae bacterium]